MQSLRSKSLDQLVLSLVIASAVACGETSFQGASGPARSKSGDNTVDPTSASPDDSNDPDAIVEGDPTVVPVDDPNPNDPNNPTKPKDPVKGTIEVTGENTYLMTLTVAAKAPVAYDIARVLPPGTAALSDGSSLPLGAHVDLTKAQFQWQSDLQDIDNVYSGRFSVKSEQAESLVDYKITVTPPEVDAAACKETVSPVIGDVKPVLKWQYQGFGVDSETEYRLTMSAPVVGDLNGDGRAEIVTILAKSGYCYTIKTEGKPDYQVGCYNNQNGPIMVLNGKTGAVMLDGYKENIVGATSTTPVLIDLESDGKPEIVTAVTINPPGYVYPNYKHKIRAYEFASKKLKFEFEGNFTCRVNCQVTAIDTDGDGKPEITAGNVVLNSDGTLRTYLVPTPKTTERTSPVVADLLPAVPGLEILGSGYGIYSAKTGQLLVNLDCTGYSAAADLDRDGQADVICMRQGKMTRFDNTGKVVWTYTLPKDPTRSDQYKNHGGAPNLADYNGDGFLDIGVAGGYYFAVVNHNGQELWKQAITDYSSSETGSTAFDLNGDGRAEALYNDEYKLRIFDGTTGTILWEVENRSGTLYEYPVIANIDDDPQAEIIVSSPGGGTFPNPSGGVRVYEEPAGQNLWVSAPKVWNQYSYYPGIVDEKLKPLPAPKMATEGFRVNKSLGFAGTNKPSLDLYVEAPLFPRREKNRVLLDFWVGNAGEIDSANEVPFQLWSKLVTTSVSITKLTEKLPKIVKGTGSLVSIELNGKDIDLKTLFTAQVNYGEDGKPLRHDCRQSNNSVSFSVQERE